MSEEKNSGFAHRLAEEEDWPELRRIYRAAVEAGAGGSPVYTPGQVRAWAAVTDDPNFLKKPEMGKIWLFEDGERNAGGFCGLAADTGYVSLLYVDPQRHRRGLGSRMLRFIEEQARECGCKQLYSKASFLSIEVFLRAGFREVWRETVHINGADFERFHVEKELS
jgi:GNAT superfamily N-acetyltransferase